VSARVLLLPLALAGCGSAAGLKPPPGRELPPPAYGQAQRPTSDQLLTPTTQQRPQRADELLRQSDERRADEFDLPPRH